MGLPAAAGSHVRWPQPGCGHPIPLATSTRVIAPDHDLREVLAVSCVPQRKLWTALSLSSFGDWLGLLA